MREIRKGVVRRVLGGGEDPVTDGGIGTEFAPCSLCKAIDVPLLWVIANRYLIYDVTRLIRSISITHSTTVARLSKPRCDNRLNPSANFLNWKGYRSGRRRTATRAYAAGEGLPAQSFKQPLDSPLISRRAATSSSACAINIAASFSAPKMMCASASTDCC